MTPNINQEEINEYIKALVLARLKRAPEGIAVSFGAANDAKPISREALIDHVQRGDEIGQKVMQVQMNFLTSLKEGTIYE